MLAGEKANSLKVEYVYIQNGGRRDTKCLVNDAVTGNRLKTGGEKQVAGGGKGGGECTDNGQTCPISMVLAVQI